MLSRPLSSLLFPGPTLSSLTRAGFATVQDLQTTSAESLAQELQISLSEAETILLSSKKPNLTQPLTQPSTTQSAALLAKNVQKISTGLPAVDDLLSGGLSCGQTLEVSGPPGTPKEIIAISVVASFVRSGREVIFIDSQNMTSPATLVRALQSYENLPPNYAHLICHHTILTLSELMIFMYHLPRLLDSHSKAALLVLNSISFPFQASHDLSMSARTALLEKIKQTLTVASTTHDLTIVTTSQLSTKILNSDGSAGNFDTGAKGILVPQLGSVYLPGRAYRMILAAQSNTSGTIKLLSTPKNPQGTGSYRSAPYEVAENGKIQ